MGTAHYLLALAGLALAVPLAGQTASGAGNFGDDSGRWANDGACDDTRFVGDRGAGALRDDDHVGRDATDCRNLLNAGRIRWGEAASCDRINSNSPYCRALVQPPSEGRQARFELFTGCAAVFPLVFVFGDEAEEFGLTEERVGTMVESRLRAARLYGDGLSPSTLDVLIRTLDSGVAFTIAIRLEKVSLYDPASGVLGHAITWEQVTFGQHGRDASFILHNLSEMLDGFIPGVPAGE